MDDRIMKIQRNSSIVSTVTLNEMTYSSSKIHRCLEIMVDSVFNPQIKLIHFAE